MTREQALHDALLRLAAVFEFEMTRGEPDADVWQSRMRQGRDLMREVANALAAPTVNEEKEQPSAVLPDDALSHADIDDTLAAIARVAEAARVGANYCALISYGTLMEVHEIITRLRE